MDVGGQHVIVLLQSLAQVVHTCAYLWCSTILRDYFAELLAVYHTALGIPANNFRNYWYEVPWPRLYKKKKKKMSV